jgi:hypothetical protein
MHAAVAAECDSACITSVDRGPPIPGISPRCASARRLSSPFREVWRAAQSISRFESTEMRTDRAQIRNGPLDHATLLLRTNSVAPIIFMSRLLNSDGKLDPIRTRSEPTRSWIGCWMSRVEARSRVRPARKNARSAMRHPGSCSKSDLVKLRASIFIGVPRRNK